MSQLLEFCVFLFIVMVPVRQTGFKHKCVCNKKLYKKILIGEGGGRRRKLTFFFFFFLFFFTFQKSQHVNLNVSSIKKDLNLLIHKKQRKKCRRRIAPKMLSRKSTQSTCTNGFTGCKFSFL